MRLAQAEVWEVATFYAHFDVVKEGETPPPPLTVRVCNSLSCALAGAEALRAALAQRRSTRAGPRAARALHGPLRHGAGGRGRAFPRRPRHPRDGGGGHRRGPLPPDDPRLRGLCHLRRPRRLRRPSRRSARARARPRRWRRRSSPPACAGSAAPASPPGASGARCAPTPPRAISRSTPTRASPAPSRTATTSSSAPHLMLEGMLIAAWAVEAAQAFIYMRDEYPAVLEILRREIAALEAAGLVAPGYVELRRGAGAYICGEESAMIEVDRGQARPAAPPAALCRRGRGSSAGRRWCRTSRRCFWVARICREGPEVLTAHRWNGRSGLRSYSVSGRVAHPRGLPAAGGLDDPRPDRRGRRHGRRATASRPTSPAAPRRAAAGAPRHVPLDFDTLQPHGTFIGSAAVVVLSDRDSAREAALNMLRFFADESCGQCTPCRVGCAKAVQLMQARALGPRGSSPSSAQTMADASICGLGQAAPNAIRPDHAALPRRSLTRHGLAILLTIYLSAGRAHWADEEAEWRAGLDGAVLALAAVLAAAGAAEEARRSRTATPCGSGRSTSASSASTRPKHGSSAPAPTARPGPAATPPPTRLAELVAEGPVRCRPAGHRPLRPPGLDLHRRRRRPRRPTGRRGPGARLCPVQRRLRRARGRCPRSRARPLAGGGGSALGVPRRDRAFRHPGLRAGGGRALRPGCAIKGNVSADGARIYHLPGGPGYARTRIDPDRGEAWFCDEAAASAAGFRPPRGAR